MALTLRRRGRL